LYAFELIVSGFVVCSDDSTTLHKLEDDCTRRRFAGASTEPDSLS
jgi:hypothetical protein